jgi:mannose-6-phosphate isomerase-like protein (cupin superfamily)
MEATWMLMIDLEQSAEFIAGDGTSLREILHPDQAQVELRYSLAHAVVRPGESSQPHTLNSSEVYYILQGTGEIYIDDEQAPIATGQAVYIPPRAVQYIRNTDSTDLKFLCIVDPAWRAEDEEIL